MLSRGLDWISRQAGNGATVGGGNAAWIFGAVGVAGAVSDGVGHRAMHCDSVSRGQWCVLVGMRVLAGLSGTRGVPSVCVPAAPLNLGSTLNGALSP